MDAFGAAVTVLDADGDHRPDVAIGVPGERSLRLIPGGRGGPALTRARRISPATLGIAQPVDPPDAWAPFGAVLGG